jgi:hypothetical protein
MGTSYEEIALLEQEFDRQCEERGIRWLSEEVRQESLNEFILEYEYGNEKPEVMLLDYGYYIKK